MLKLLFQIAGAALRLIGRGAKALLNTALSTGYPEQVKVIRAVDGDSLKGIDEDGKVREIRIRGMDAPELFQEGGREAQQALERLVEGKKVTLEDPEIDKYGRIAASIRTPDGDCVAEEMIEEGAAWSDPFQDDPRHNKVEEAAERAKRGIWKKGTPTPPWEFRKKNSGQDGPPMN